jgi:hypothetical protein
VFDAERPADVFRVMSVSPSQVSFGPGGCLLEFRTARKLVRVSVGDDPFCSAMSLACIFLMLNPDPMSLGKKLAGVM